MLEFYFKCPFCDNNISALPEQKGLIGKCPYCDREIIIRDTEQQNTPATQPGAAFQENELPQEITSDYSILDVWAAQASSIPAEETPQAEEISQAKKTETKEFICNFLCTSLVILTIAGWFATFFYTNLFWRVIFISPLFVSAIVFCVKGIKHHLKDYHKDGPLNLVMTPRQRRAYNNIWNCIIYAIFYPLILFAIAWWGLDFIRFIFAPGFWEHLLSIEPFFFLVFTASGGISLGVGLSFWSRRR